MKLHLQIGALAALLALAACEPEERAEWSPDGSRAAILVEQRLHFVNLSAGLSDPIPDHDKGPGRLLFHCFGWLPDGGAVVVHRVRVAPDWQLVRALLPENDVARIETLAVSVATLLSAAVTLHGDADRADQLLAKIAPGEGTAVINALRLALANDAQSVRGALADAPRALVSLDTAEGEVSGFVLHEIALVRPESPGSGETISRGLRSFHSIAASPRHPHAAGTVETSEANRYDLVIQPLDGSPAVTIARSVSRAFAWSPDGESLVYLSPVSRGGEALMKIERRRVLDAAGQLLPENASDGAVVELAYALVPFAPRLAVLPDGDILFAAQPGSLPAPAGEPKENPRLYRLPANGGEALAIPTAEGALPMDLGYFVASPDGRRLVVIESATDAVAVVDLESGKSELVVSPHPGWKSRLLPAWRNASEFSYAATDPDSGRVHWMLWKDGNSADLSANWPADTTSGWMEFKETTP